jgi:ATP/maltotriose-dependent transcriptional regulator MalT
VAVEQGTGSVGETARTGPWLELYQELAARDPAGLDAAELEALAEAAWWLCRTGESIAARHRAHAAFRRAGDDRGAARTAARLFHEHFYRGETAVAVGWLRRGFRHVEEDQGCRERGWLECARAELHLHQGPLDRAAGHAAAAGELARAHGDADLAAIGMQLQGRALVAQGAVEEGLALLDEAMTFVLAGELAPLHTGWVYCSVILACRDLADLRRAGEWTEAARRWCRQIPATTPYSQGLCRIYRGEVLTLRGEWAEAEAELRLAHDELLPHKPGGAAEASYGVGEVLRRRGDLAAAEQAFTLARREGWDPQPGLALLRLAQGRVDAAAAALRSTLASPPQVDRFAHARLLAAQVEVSIAAGDLDQAREAARQLADVEQALASPVVSTTAATAAGALRLAEGDPAGALERLRQALRGWRDLGLPYEEARARLRCGAAVALLGDSEGGRVEIEAARAGFERLGAAADARQAAALLLGRQPRRLLTDREVEVLRLVAAGGSNRDIAGALHLSEHTVARHMQNVFAKLGVSSRAAAISRAIEQGQLAADG